MGKLGMIPKRKLEHMELIAYEEVQKKLNKEGWDFDGLIALSIIEKLNLEDVLVVKDGIQYQFEITSRSAAHGLGGHFGELVKSAYMKNNNAKT